jgi:hypothetical protein
LSDATANRLKSLQIAEFDLADALILATLAALWER